MAPRTRRQAAGAPAPAQRSDCSFADVPTGVLQHILGFLDSQKDRCGLSAASLCSATPAAARRSSRLVNAVRYTVLCPPPCRHRAVLVCRQWHDCVHSPDICGEVEANGFHSSAAFDSLACWLRRHGQHVRSLHLERGRTGLADDPDEYLLMGCCLSLTAAVGQLERLHIATRGGLVVSAAWMQPLRRLRELSLQAAPDGLLINTTLEHHTQLTALSMRAAPLVFRAGVQLPPSLLRLELSDRSYEELPSQVGAGT